METFGVMVLKIESRGVCHAPKIKSNIEFLD